MSIRQERLDCDFDTVAAMLATLKMCPEAKRLDSLVVVMKTFVEHERWFLTAGQPDEPAAAEPGLTGAGLAAAEATTGHRPRRPGRIRARRSARHRTEGIGAMSITAAEHGMWSFSQCDCGHLYLFHDIEEYAGDGSDICCVEGCNQVGCPGRQPRPDWVDDEANA
jgi:hypothetical protein